MALDLDADFDLPQASRYAFPRDGAQYLPLCYGDLLSSTVVPNDHEDGGFLPAVCIDRTNLVYCLNAKPVPSTPAPQIYVGDYAEPQNTSVYTFNPSVNYEGKGTIATVQFHVNLGDAEVSWRGHGTASGGALIQNPVDGIVDALTTFASVTSADFDSGLRYDAMRTMNELGLTFHWAFTQPRPVRDWLTEIGRCYLIDFWTNETGLLALQADRAAYGLSQPVTTFINAQTDLVGDEDAVRYTVDAANVVNTLTVKRRRKWSPHDPGERAVLGEYTDEPAVDHRPSVNLYGVLRGEVELPAVYTDAHTLLWVKAFFARYGLMPALVTFTVRGLGLVPALPGTYVGFEWPWFGWSRPRLLKVLNQDLDPNEETPSVTLTCFDCQRFTDDPFSLPSATVPSNRRRVRTPKPKVDLVAPGPASNLSYTGAFRQVTLRWTVPLDRDYDHTEIWLSTTNNRATATFFRNAGNQVPPGASCEEVIKTADGATGYVWLMTVDKSGNGKSGSGNWYPASATGGFFAQASLIPTDAIEVEAVTRLVRTTSGLTGTMTGPIAVSSVRAPSTPATGYFDFHCIQTVQVPSLCTLVIEIRQGTITGAVWGQVVLPNILTIGIQYAFICMGQTPIPTFGADYGAVLQVINQNGNQVPFVVSPNSVAFTLSHHKR